MQLPLICGARVGLAFVLLAIAACSTRNCTGDPLTDDAFCAANSLSTGQYDRRAEVMRQEQIETQRVALTEQTTREQLSGELAQLVRRRRELESQLEKMELDLDRLMRLQITSASEILELRRQLDVLKARARQRLDPDPVRAERQLDEVAVAAKMLSDALALRFRGHVVR